jgi:hypothetical protein
LWGLGMGVALCPHESMIGLATQLFLQALPVVEHFSSPRAWAFTIVGIHAYLRRYGATARSDDTARCSPKDWPATSPTT